MRTASIVLAVYGILLVVGALWHAIAILPEQGPEIAAIASVYLGLTARRTLAGAVGASVVIGYLSDLLSGTPVGLYALVSGGMCLLGYAVHRRIVVRGVRFTIGFSIFVALAASLLVAILRWMTSQPTGTALSEAIAILGPALPTAVIGPLLLRLLRRIDAAFARTHRERDAALEGLVP
jgi:cell shape-determining protein MreD